MDPTPCDGIADGLRGPVIGDATAVARVGSGLRTWTPVGDAAHVHTPSLATIASRRLTPSLATIASRVHAPFFAPFFAPSFATIAWPIGRAVAAFDPAASSGTAHDRRRHGKVSDG